MSLSEIENLLNRIAVEGLVSFSRAGMGLSSRDTTFYQTLVDFLVDRRSSTCNSLIIYQFLPLVLQWLTLLQVKMIVLLVTMYT